MELNSASLSTNQEYLNLAEDIKLLILKATNLQQVKPSDVKLDTPLFKEGLGLDSIDLLEIVVSLEKHYGYRVKNDEDGRKVLQNIGTLTTAIWNSKTLKQ